MVSWMSTTEMVAVVTRHPKSSTLRCLPSLKTVLYQRQAQTFWIRDIQLRQLVERERSRGGHHQCCHRMVHQMQWVGTHLRQDWLGREVLQLLQVVHLSFICHPGLLRLNSEPSNAQIASGDGELPLEYSKPKRSLEFFVRKSFAPLRVCLWQCCLLMYVCSSGDANCWWGWCGGCPFFFTPASGDFGTSSSPKVGES